MKRDAAHHRGCLGKAEGGQIFDSCDQLASQQHLETSLNQLSECSVRWSPSLQCNKSCVITLQGHSDGSELPAVRRELPSVLTLTAHFSNFLERVQLYGSLWIEPAGMCMTSNPLLITLHPNQIRYDTTCFQRQIAYIVFKHNCTINHYYVLARKKEKKNVCVMKRVTPVSCRLSSSVSAGGGEGGSGRRWTTDRGWNSSICPLRERK